MKISSTNSVLLYYYYLNKIKTIEVQYHVENTYIFKSNLNFNYSKKQNN